MKKFLSENWFKLMTGTSMLVFSFGFLLYAVSPTYANNSNKEDKTIKPSGLTSEFDDYYIIESKGKLYFWKSKMNCLGFMAQTKLNEPISKENKVGIVPLP